MHDWFLYPEVAAVIVEQLVAVQECDATKDAQGFADRLKIIL